MILKIDFENPEKSTCNQAADVLKKGGLIVYPTDTAYGIGANALDASALGKLYKVKQRDQVKPTHVVVRDWDMIEQVAYVNDISKKIYDKYMPGAITMILPKKDIIPNILTGGLDTIGVRIPDTKFTRLLSQLVDFPYTTPSANRATEPTPYSVEEVSKVLDLEQIDLVVDAGARKRTLPSTIVDISHGELKILREGPVTISI